MPSKIAPKLPNERLIKELHAGAPLGKKGKIKKVIKPFSKEITQYLSGRPTKVPEIKEITIQELFNIPTISIQREVIDRLAKNRKYLADPTHFCMETGRVFTAARYPDGSMDIIDGNTRIYNYYMELLRCIEKGETPRFEIPATVTLVIHDVESKEEGKLLYNTFDNKNAVETPLDKMKGAKDELELNFKKPYVSRVNFKQGLKIFASNIPGVNIEHIPTEEYGLLKEFTPELEFMDEHSDFDSYANGDDIATIAGMLRKVRGVPSMQNRIIKFANYVFSASGEGVIANPNGSKNAVWFLRDEYTKKKHERRFGHRSSKRYEVLGMWAQYFDDWQDGKDLYSATKLSDELLKQKAKAFLTS